MYPYNDPSQQQAQPFPVPGFPGAQEAVSSPMAGFEQSYAQVMQGAAPQGIRVESQTDAWAKGAVIGFGAWYLARRMRARRQLKGEWTTPFARFLMIWWGFMLAGFGLSMAWPTGTGWFLGVAFALGTVLSLVYFIYRVTGHGRWNSRRQGSPWRGDHRRTRHWAHRTPAVQGSLQGDREGLLLARECL
jgi:hypothetical protein